MTAPTVSIQAVVRDVVQRVDINFDAGSWLYDVMHAVFEPYACNDPDSCPNRPAWDKARSELFEELSGKLDVYVEDMAKWLVATTTPALEKYAAEYPDAPRAVAKP